MLPGPILASLSMLMFLLVMQFLMKFLPRLVGKDLPIGVFFELIAYNLAYMFVLAVPMAVLIATLMTFGKLVDSNAYAVIKSSGVSFPQLVWPVLAFGLLTAAAMIPFNNEVLPEANFRAKNLWTSIRAAKPGFDLKPGVFYDDIDRYKIRVDRIDSSDANVIHGVTIYDYSDGQRYRAEILAENGRLQSTPDGTMLKVELFNGQLHRRRPPGSGARDRYEEMSFDRYRLQISTVDLKFDRSDPTSGSRNDRSMPSRVMMAKVDSLDTMRGDETRKLKQGVALLGTGGDTPLLSTPARFLTSGVRTDAAALPRGRTQFSGRDLHDIAMQQARNAQSQIERSRYNIEWTRREADQMRVEIHKKNSIAIACLIFVLIGAPLGLAIRRGGLGVAATAALAIFLFYWVTLVMGEKLADEGKLEPWIGMWAGNVVTGIVGIVVLLYIAFDLRAVRPPWQRSLGPDSIRSD